MMTSHGSRGARIMTFGLLPGLQVSELTALLNRFSDAIASRSGTPSPSGSPCTRRSRSPAPPALLTDDAAAGGGPQGRLSRALEEGLANLTLSIRGSGEIEEVKSIELARVSNAVTVAAASLPPDVIRALAHSKAIPCVFFRHLTPCFVEVCSRDLHYA
jgi:hypothetical protein